MKRMLAATGLVIAAAGGAATARPAADLPVHRGTFFSHGDCVHAGQHGADRGHWSRYQCAKGWLWNLWTDR